MFGTPVQHRGAGLGTCRCDLALRHRCGHRDRSHPPAYRARCRERWRRCLAWMGVPTHCPSAASPAGPGFTRARRRREAARIRGRPRSSCGPFPLSLRSVCGLQTNEQSRTRANTLPRCPPFSGIFARVRCCSRFSNQSGRTVRVGFLMPFSGRRLRISYAHTASMPRHLASHARCMPS